MYEPTTEKRQHIVWAQTVGTGVSVCAEGRETEGNPRGGERKKKKKKEKKIQSGPRFRGRWFRSVW